MRSIERCPESRHVGLRRCREHWKPQQTRLLQFFLRRTPLSIRSQSGMTNTTLAQTQLIGVDWGLTHLRAYRIGQDGRIFEQRESSQGVLAIESRGFAAALHQLIGDWLIEHAESPLYLCGMIGSRNGWYEAAYSRCPTAIDQVAASALVVDIGDRKAILVGGVSFTGAAGTFDVIRGEETQLFGVSTATGTQCIVTPGTHSKWVFVRDGSVEHFRTYMTGELYAVLRQHSSLGLWMRNTQPEAAAEDERSFVEGVQTSLQDLDLLHSLFTVRTRALLKDRPAAAHAAYLSGILIGNEVAQGLRQTGARTLTLIASTQLESLYRTALSAAGVDRIDCVAGHHAVARGLWRLWKCRARQ